MVNDEIIENLTGKLTENAKKDKLYIAIILNDTAEIERLRAEGAKLTEHIRGVLKNGGQSFSFLLNNGYLDDSEAFDYSLVYYSPEEFVAVIRDLHAELGEHICCCIGDHIRGFYTAEVFGCVLDCFDNRKLKKKQTLLNIIDHDQTELLHIAAEHGWLWQWKKCNEYIEYAREHGHVECAAFLLDFKNKNFDTALELQKEEKRRNAELNASPNSVTVLRKLWQYRDAETEGTLKIVRYKGERTEITVPQRIGKKTVTELEIEVYSRTPLPMKPFAASLTAANIKKITLPEGILSIGDSVFYDFRELCEINIQDGLLSIGAYAFFNCQKLKALTLPDSVREIGAEAFSGCAKLEEINIPKGLTRIERNMFNKCKKLKSVEIPENVETVGRFAFVFSGVETVTFSSGVTEIGRCAFQNCAELTHIELPDTLVKIDSSAFYCCGSLKEIVIPEGVREIGCMAFSGCYSLERVVLPASLEKAKNYTEKGMEPKTIFYASPKVTAVVTPKSYAEKYCKRNNIPFVYK